jgi:hypothetical protein
VLRFSFAGLPIEARESHPGALADLAPIYPRFATSDPPRLVVTVERVAGFDRAPRPGYPAFERRATDDGRLHVERYDAEGVVDAGASPITAHFRVGPSANSLEACLRIAASVALARDGAVILHASAVVHAGRALVFTGVSGAGKSTISSMLADAYPSCAKIADELLVLRSTAAGVTLEVPPYLGPAGVAHGATAPLAAIHFLIQAPFDRREPVPAGAALRELLRHVLVYVAEPTTAERVLAVVAAVTATTPCFHLHFRKEPHVGTVLEIAAPPDGPPAS